MKLRELFEFLIQKGIETDPRTAAGIKDVLADEKKKLDALPEEEKKYFDYCRLTNPYADSRILNGDDSCEIKAIAVGIDMEGPELLLVDRLREKGKKIDCVMTHHPEGKAYVKFHQVMSLQADLISKYGVPINIGEGLMEPRMKEVNRRVMPQNHNRPVDFARLLDIPYFNCHTPADNHVAQHLQNRIDKEQPKKLEDIVKLLLQEPEYSSSALATQGPVILVGSKEKSAGKIFVDMTGGTEGPVKYIEKLAAGGVGTIVGMHFSDDHMKEAEKNNVYMIVAGHIASDNLGINLILDKVEAKFGKLEFIGCSGFERFRR